MRKWSKRSQKVYDELDPRLQRYLDRTLREVADITLLEGHRGKAAQDAAYFGKPQRSKLRWPRSKHNAKPSLAVDFRPYPRPPSELGLWAGLAYIAGRIIHMASVEGVAIRWGGNWNSDGDFSTQPFADLYHLELVDTKPKTKTWMKNALAGTLGCLSLVLAGNLFELTDWQEACRYTRSTYSCAGIDEPTIVYETMRDGDLGYYGGGDTIHVNKDLQGISRQVTIFHEMVHYLQAQSGKHTIPGTARDVCAAEAETFAFTDVYKGTFGLAPLGSSWWRYYPMCWPYYAPAGGYNLLHPLPYVDPPPPQ